MTASRNTIAPDQPLPDGFVITLDESARELAPGIWRGGSPTRVVRLTPAGATAWADLGTGAAIATPAAGRLARRLTDAGLAHPGPPPPAVAPDVTVVVPVLDRAAALERCLAALGRAHPVVVVDDGSRDPAAIAAVVERHGGRLVRCPVNQGPAAARNAGLAAVETDLVAFVDSDCVPPPGWLAPLAAHLADPLVAAVAPRIRPLAGPATTVGHYTAARGSLDLGARPSLVAPGARVSYVPTAALLARRTALHAVARGREIFDPALRVGEDVDLVWRLHHAGWRVRFEPGVEVAHDEPRTWAGLLGRRFRYGTSAAPLARAHPRDAAPLVVHPWPMLTVAALLARRPVAAAGAFGIAVLTTAHSLRRAEVPTRGVAATVAGATAQTGLGLGRYATQFAAPGLAAATVTGPRGRRLAAAALLLAPPLVAWRERRPELDPLRYLAAHVADEIAYGTGVWAGAVNHRTTAPLRPRLGRRVRPRRSDSVRTRQGN